ncbi:CEP76 C2 domain-containing protein [Chytriomyces sp. MP71]|nr:CEP76 C2 domain-containing protein [Chytriomyces sp. MP71]
MKMNGQATDSAKLDAAVRASLASHSALIGQMAAQTGSENALKNLLLQTGIVDQVAASAEAKLATHHPSLANAEPGLGDNQYCYPYGGIHDEELLFASSGEPRTERLFAGAQLAPNKRYLMLTIARGSAFLGLDDLREDARTSLGLHLLYKQKRFESKLVSSTVEPAFEFQRLIELHSADTQVVLQSQDKIHIVVSRAHHPSGMLSLLGTAELDIREALCGSSSGAPRRPAKKQLEVKEAGEDVTVGILEVVMEVVPRDAAYIPVSLDEVNFQLKREQRQFDEINRLFFVHARQWWNDYLQIRPSHAQRLVKIFAIGENGVKLPVTNFISPIRSRYIDSPRHAVRFVSLLNIEHTQSVGISKTEVWAHPHTTLTLSKANASSLALLLTSLLVGFSSPAYTLLGTTHAALPCAWVAIVNPGGAVELIDPGSGARYSAASEDMPWRTCGCMFNEEGFWANVAGTDLVRHGNFDVRDGRCWKALGRDAVMSMKRPVANFPLLPYMPPKYLNTTDSVGTLDVIPAITTCEMDLEAILKSQIALFRDDHDLLTAWDDDLSHLLGQCLWGCEMDKMMRNGKGISSGGVNSVEFQEGVRSSIPEGHTFKGFPVHFNTLNPQRIFTTFTTTKSCRNLLMTRGDKVRFGICVRVFPYAEKCVACWVMIAVRYRAYSE